MRNLYDSIKVKTFPDCVIKNMTANILRLIIKYFNI